LAPASGSPAGLQIPLLHTPIYPYLTAGLGAFRVQNRVDSVTTNGSTCGTTTTVSNTTPATPAFKFGFDAGVGLGLRLRRVTAFAEGKVQDVYSNQGMIKSTKQISAVPVSVGLLFYVL
jgi:hypothetical protein